MLFRSLMEFNPSEQLELLTKLARLSKPTTIMIIDIVPPGLQSNATHSTGQSVTIQLNDLPPIHGYAPTLEELQRHAVTIGMEIAFVPYWTETGRKRVQCILVPRNSPHLSQVRELAHIKSEFFERQRAYEQHRANGQNSNQVARALNPTFF